MFFHDRSIFLTKDFYFGRHFWEVSVINQLVLRKASDSIMKTLKKKNTAVGKVLLLLSVVSRLINLFKMIMYSQNS